MLINSKARHVLAVYRVFGQKKEQGTTACILIVCMES